MNRPEQTEALAREIYVAHTTSRVAQWDPEHLARVAFDAAEAFVAESRRRDSAKPEARGAEKSTRRDA